MTTLAKGGYTPRRISNDYVGVDVGLRGHALLAVITAACASGFLLVGYDNGVMGGLVDTPQFKKSFNNPNSDTIGNIVSLYEIGCFFGAMSTFVIGNPLGRRKTIALGCIFMVAGAIIQAACSSVGVMIFGRIVSGLGMGAINATVPVLQAETSPALSRGKLVAIDLTVLNIGIVLSYWTDYGFNFSSGLTSSVVWRVPIALQCVFIIVLFLIALIIPDTPRWLASRGRHEEAIAILERLADQPAESLKVRDMYTGIVEAIAHERALAASGNRWQKIVAPGGGWKDDALQTRRRILLACFIQMAQQMGGINGIIYYSSTLFSQSIKLKERPAAVLGGCLNIALIFGSTISIFVIDVVGRRKLLLPCITLMACVMIVQTVLIKKVEEYGDTRKEFGRAAIGMLFTFQFLFSLGFQATVWLIPSEVLPLRVRTEGSALSTASNWISNFAVVKFTPSAISNIGHRTYIIFAVTNAAWVPIIYFFLPETRNKTLEEVDEIFARDGWNLRNDHTHIENGEDAKADALGKLDKYSTNHETKSMGSDKVNETTVQQTDAA